MLKIWVVQLFEESSENLVDGGGRACKGGYSPTKGHHQLGNEQKYLILSKRAVAILHWFWKNVIKSYFENI